MKRESGYYWVKHREDTNPVIREYCSIKKHWLLVAGTAKDRYWYKIFPERIKTPDEV